MATAVALAASPTALPSGETGPETQPINGIAPDGALLAATFEPRHFDLDQDGNLIVAGRITGMVTHAGSPPVNVDQQVVLPVDRRLTTANCDLADIAVGPQDATLAGEPLHLDQVTVNISMPQGPGSRLMVPLCAAGEMLKDPSAQANPGLRDVFNQMLGLLGQGG